MDWIGWATFGIAVVGATLGIFNVWWMVRRDAVRLRVRLVSQTAMPSGQVTLGIEVSNLGYTAITLSEVAIRAHPFRGNRMAIVSDYFDRARLPLRMEPRTCVTIAVVPEIRSRIKQEGARWCSATTACGISVVRRFKVG